MGTRTYTKATRPTFYFIGVTTGKSSIMKVFPEWAKFLGLADVVIKGIDFKPHDDPPHIAKRWNSLKTIRYRAVPWSPPIKSIC